MSRVPEMLRPDAARPPRCEEANESAADRSCRGALPPFGDDSRGGTVILAFEDKRWVITEDGEVEKPDDP